ncbi:MAG: efflux RND transporter periplasmic adaptor subunit [Armatimonadetes bacterium]|nr:efflux RND transporter periplasmic adaptor subunit [Armatimonadota bacterium]
MKKAVWFILVLLIVLCGGGAIAYRTFQAAQAKVAEAGKIKDYKVEKGDITVQVVETGALDAIRSVEVKSRVQGRVAKLLVKEGDVVTRGQLIAVIDPKETELRVEQDRAQLRGAKSAVVRNAIEIRQRRVTAQAAYERAKIRIAQLKKELEAQPALSKASVEVAEANYRSALQAREKLVKVDQPNERASAVALLEDAKSSLSNAIREEARRKALLDKGYISLREYQDAELQRSLAKSKLDTAQTRMDKLQDQEATQLKTADETIQQARSEMNRARTTRTLDVTKTQDLQTAQQSLRDAEAALEDPAVLEQSREQSQSTVDQLESSLRDSERQLSETEIRAPIDGVVTKKLIQEGELVASLSSFSSGTPIVRIEDRKAMLIKLNINEIDVARLELGMSAKVRVDAIPSKDYTGKVSKIAPTSAVEAAAAGGQTNVVKYEVEITLDQNDTDLKSGMSAQCTVVTLEHKNVVRVATEYLGKDEKGSFVMISGGKGKPATRRDVRLGAQTGSSAEVLEGLKGGEVLEKPEYKGPPRTGAFSAQAE